jgi:single-strand DNA-binding protein
MLCAFAIGTTRYYEANGARKQETSFIDCKAWAEVAQRASELSKGSKVIIEGRLEQERWQGDDGVQRSRLVVIADRVVAVA